MSPPGAHAAAGMRPGTWGLCPAYVHIDCWPCGSCFKQEDHLSSSQGLKVGRLESPQYFSQFVQETIVSQCQREPHRHESPE